MKKASLFVAIAVLLLPAFSGPIDADDSTTLTGEYIWNRQDVPSEIEAVFTPAGESKWDVSFHFDFRNEGHIYTGTAEGSLTEGPLKGEVKNENKKRTFIFSGKFTDGVFEGTHAEMRDGKELDTGVIKLSS